LGVFQTGKVTDKTKHGLLAFKTCNQAEMGIREEIVKDSTKYYKKLPLQERLPEKRVLCSLMDFHGVIQGRISLLQVLVLIQVVPLL
jgi:hypothetical protein